MRTAVISKVRRPVVLVVALLGSLAAGCVVEDADALDDEATDEATDDGLTIDEAGRIADVDLGSEVAAPVDVPLAAAGGRRKCEVKVNGKVVRKLMTLDREDCYAKTSFGNRDCEAYAPYLVAGVSNLIEQYFDGTDGVNTDTYCQRPAILPPTCNVVVRGVIVNKMGAYDRNTCFARTSFGSANCAVYAPYFAPGSNSLAQFFAGTDRVNSQACTGAVNPG